MAKSKKVTKTITNKRKSNKNILKQSNLNFLSWKVLVPALILFAAVGGYFVAQSFAGSGVKAGLPGPYGNLVDNYASTNVYVCRSGNRFRVDIFRPINPPYGIKALRANVQQSVYSSSSGKEIETKDTLPSSSWLYGSIQRHYTPTVNSRNSLVYVSAKVRFSNGRLQWYRYDANAKPDSKGRLDHGMLQALRKNGAWVSGTIPSC